MLYDNLEVWDAWRLEGSSRGRDVFMHIADPLEKAMAAHSSTLTWKIPWTEEPGMLRAMGTLRVGQE